MKFYNALVTSLLAMLISYGAMASPPAGGGHPHGASMAGPRVYGKVVTTIDTKNYTYVQLDTGSKKYWAAGPKTKLSKGNMIAIDTGMPFNDFESKELKRKFDTVYFVGQFITDQPDKNASMSDPHAGLGKSDEVVSLKGIKKLKDGKTVEEVFAQKTALAGKAVRVRGKVMKYTAKVMGKNWLHIQDSSGSRLLVVTTDQEASKGDLVVINGIVATDLDLGYGYTYDVIVERAIVNKE